MIATIQPSTKLYVPIAPTLYMRRDCPNCSDLQPYLEEIDGGGLGHRVDDLTGSQDPYTRPCAKVLVGPLPF